MSQIIKRGRPRDTISKQERVDNVMKNIKDESLRPYVEESIDKDDNLRAQWRKASTKYYKQNRDEVLRRARIREPQTCQGCAGLVEWGSSDHMLLVRESRWLCEYKQMFVDPKEKKTCDREPMCIEDVL